MRTFYLGVGAQKSATSWLFNQLIKSDRYKSGFCKEYHVFDYWYLDNEKARKNAPKRIKNFARMKAYPKWRAVKFQKESESIIETFFEDVDNYYDYFESILTDDLSFSADISPAYSMLSSKTLSSIRDAFKERGIQLKVVFLMREPISRLESQIRMRLRNNGNIFEENSEKMTIKIANALTNDALNVHGNYSYTCTQLDEVFPKEDVFYGFYETLFKTEELERLSDFVDLSKSHFNANKRVNKTIRPFSYEKKDLLTFQAYAQEQYEFVEKRFGLNAEIWHQELMKLVNT